MCLGLLGMLIITGGCGKSSPPPQEVRLIPLKDFFRNPEKTEFKISPNAEYLSFLMPWQHRLNIYVQKKPGTTKATAFITKRTASTFTGPWKFFWANIWAAGRKSEMIKPPK